MAKTFTIAKPLSLNEVHTITISNAERTQDNRNLIITGTAEDGAPARLFTFIGNEVSQEIVFGGILAQLECYGEFPSVTAMINAIKDAKGKTIQVKLVPEPYEDPNTLEEKTGTRIYFDPTRF